MQNFEFSLLDRLNLNDWKAFIDPIDRLIESRFRTSEVVDLLRER